MGLTIRCKVRHPENPTVEVDAVCRVEAILQAAHLWDVDFSEVATTAKVTAKKADIEAYVREREARQMSIGGV